MVDSKFEISLFAVISGIISWVKLRANFAEVVDDIRLEA